MHLIPPYGDAELEFLGSHPQFVPWMLRVPAPISAIEWNEISRKPELVRALELSGLRLTVTGPEEFFLSVRGPVRFENGEEASDLLRRFHEVLLQLRELLHARRVQQSDVGNSVSVVHGLPSGSSPRGSAEKAETDLREYVNSLDPQTHSANEPEGEARYSNNHLHK